MNVGWFLVAYDDGESIWSRLTEDDFNCARVGSWRLDLDAQVSQTPASAAASGELEENFDEEEGGSETEGSYDADTEEGTSEAESEPADDEDSD